MHRPNTQKIKVRAKQIKFVFGVGSEGCHRWQAGSDSFLDVDTDPLMEVEMD